MKQLVYLVNAPIEELIISHVYQEQAKKKKNGRVNHLPRLSRKSKKMKLSFRGTIVYRVINNIYIKCHTPFPNSIYLQTQLKPIHSINSSELFYNYYFKEISLALYVHI